MAYGFPHYWPFVIGIYRSSVDSHQKGPVMQSSIFYSSLNMLLNKQSKCQRFGMPWHSCDVSNMNNYKDYQTNICAAIHRYAYGIRCASLLEWRLRVNVMENRKWAFGGKMATSGLLSTVVPESRWATCPIDKKYQNKNVSHYGDVIMGTIASQITSFAIVYSTVYSGADQRKHQSSASLAFVRGIHRIPVNSPHKCQ